MYYLTYKVTLYSYKMIILHFLTHGVSLKLDINNFHAFEKWIIV